MLLVICLFQFCITLHATVLQCTAGSRAECAAIHYRAYFRGVSNQFIRVRLRARTHLVVNIGIGFAWSHAHTLSRLSEPPVHGPLVRSIGGTVHFTFNLYGCGVRMANWRLNHPLNPEMSMYPSVRKRFHAGRKANPHHRQKWSRMQDSIQHTFDYCARTYTHTSWHAHKHMNFKR